MASLPQLTSRLQEVSSDVELEHILNSNLNKLVVVFFYSTTCQTCERIRPDIMALSGEMTSHLFLHIDVENGLTTAKKYDLQSLPSFLLFFNKKLLEKVYSWYIVVCCDTFLLRNLIQTSEHWDWELILQQLTLPVILYAGDYLYNDHR